MVVNQQRQQSERGATAIIVADAAALGATIDCVVDGICDPAGAQAGADDIGGRFVEFVSLEDAPAWSGTPPPDLGLSHVSLSG